MMHTSYSLKLPLSIALALSLSVGMSACSILLGGDDDDAVGEIHTSPYSSSGEDIASGSKDADADTEGTRPDEPNGNQPADLPDVAVDPTVVGQSCWVEFDENNEISGRTPSFQALLTFNSDNPEALLGSVVEITFTRPDGESKTFTKEIGKDTSSDKPIMHITTVDENLPAGTYTW